MGHGVKVGSKVSETSAKRLKEEEKEGEDAVT